MVWRMELERRVQESEKWDDTNRRWVGFVCACVRVSVCCGELWRVVEKSSVPEITLRISDSSRLLECAGNALASWKWIKLSPNNNTNHCYQNNKQICIVFWVSGARLVRHPNAHARSTKWEKVESFVIVNMDDIKMNCRSPDDTECLVVKINNNHTRFKQLKCWSRHSNFFSSWLKCVVALLTHYTLPFECSAFSLHACQFAFWFFSTDFSIPWWRRNDYTPGLRFIRFQTDNIEIWQWSVEKRA